MIVETEFTPLSALVGGGMIGLSSALLFVLNGKIFGVSGIVNRVLPASGASADRFMNLAIIVGLVAAPLVFMGAGWAEPLNQQFTAGLPLLALAGLLVGFGTVLGSGCTSGHGICGLSRLSLRSAVAVGTFMLTGFASVWVLRHVVGV
ncbi:YeeE/YedE family protein [Flexibacterium corallicola]|uniref:YeeE/YedE family protein n=1 Tax=Flexibacterium corallicola TaxID=3037259 RepID=UPI00286EF2F7|nr:YeeE/YedE family protein [Pseudovibrio sp. M1P-2-3]